MSILAPEGVRSIEEITGYKLNLVDYASFQDRAKRIDRLLFCITDPPMKLGYVHVPDWSEWLTDKSMIGRHTRNASKCVAGVAIRGDFAERVFHYPSFTEPELITMRLDPREVQFGLFSSGSPVTRADEELIRFYEGLGLTFIEPPEGIENAHFGILVDKLNKEILYYFEEYE